MVQPSELELTDLWTPDGRQRTTSRAAFKLKRAQNCTSNIMLRFWPSSPGVAAAGHTSPLAAAAFWWRWAVSPQSFVGL